MNGVQFGLLLIVGDPFVILFGLYLLVVWLFYFILWALFSSIGLGFCNWLLALSMA